MKTTSTLDEEGNLFISRDLRNCMNVKSWETLKLEYDGKRLVVSKVDETLIARKSLVDLLLILKNHTVVKDLFTPKELEGIEESLNLLGDRLQSYAVANMQ